MAKPARPEAWLSRQAMADALDVSPSYFDRAIRPHAAKEHVRNKGRRRLFYARGVLDRWYESRLAPPATPDQLTAEQFDLEHRLLSYELQLENDLPD